MSSAAKKSSRSGSGSKSSSGSRSGSKSSSKSSNQNKSSSSNGGDEDEWTEWDWDDRSQREYRGRLGRDGEWEYEVRYPKQDSVPRTPGLGSVQEEMDGQPSATPKTVQDQLPALTSDAGIYYTHTTQPQSLNRDLSNMHLDSSVTQNDGQSYGTGRIDPELSRTEVPRSPPGYNYPMPSAPFGSQFMGSSLPAASPATMQPFATPLGTLHQSSLQQEQSGSTATTEAARYISQSTLEESGTQEGQTLDKDFKLYNSKHFKFGKVFKTLWTEPKGQGNPNNPKRTDTRLFRTKFGEEYYTSIRRFVIVRAFDGHCLCLPIFTYRKQGTNKPGVKPQNHAIIYTENKKRKGAIPKEATNEAKLEYKPIQMEPKTHRHQLSELSRLNYAKIYTVEHNVKVCFIGRIHDDSKVDFMNTYNFQHQAMDVTNVNFDEDVEDEYESEERDTEAPIS